MDGLGGLPPRDRRARATEDAFHDLRHAHATHLLSTGVHVKAVSERLGHSSTSFTMDTYSAEIPSMGRVAADAADQLFSEGGGE